MKKILSLSAIVATSVLLASCAGPIASGALYTSTSTGLSASGNAGTKVGQACNTSILGLIATGDASIAAAKADGHITQVSSVDYTANNVLGIYGTYCTVVKGN
jgi:hypothetical protein